LLPRKLRKGKGCPPKTGRLFLVERGGKKNNGEGSSPLSKRKKRGNKKTRKPGYDIRRGNEV